MKDIVIIIICAFLINQLSFAQDSSRNGYYLPPNGTIRFFLVFAEAPGDPDDPGSKSNWTAGQMPDNPEDYIDPSYVNPGSISGYLTKYFYQASLGDLFVLGDYYPDLVQVGWDTMSGNGTNDVIDYLDGLPGDDIETENGYSINSDDFDFWTPTSYLQSKTNSADDYNDFLVIIWRTNHRVGSSNNSGFTVPSTYANPLKDKSGFNAYTCIQSYNSDAWNGLRHEYAHQLLGGNSFHSGGAGAGKGTYLSNMGGFSLLASYNRNLNGPNSWDRWRLGWKTDSHTYYISARKPSDNSELDTDLTYGQTFPGGTNEFILRDFITYGDAIRIELPYLQTENPNSKKQWLWLENHQLLEGNIDEKSCMNEGLYINIQIGNNNLGTTSNSSTNYISPINNFGNYDFSYETYQTDKYKIVTSDELQNPFTGYHLSMLPAYNYIDPNGSVYDKIYNTEYITPAAVEFNDSYLSENDICYLTYPVFGTIYDAFLEGDKIGIGTNPSPISVFTYRTPSRSSTSAPYSAPQSDDNRKIYLNSLSIEVVDQLVNGNIKVKILWDDFEILQNNRWCGDIVLNEDLILGSDKTLILDQGLTPTKPTNPITFQGQDVFAEPTTLTANDGSYMEIEEDAKVSVKDNSEINFESGSELSISGELEILGDGEVTIENGSEIEAFSGAIITVDDDNSTFNVESGATYDLCNATIQGDGNGYIDGVPLILEFEDQSLSGTEEYQAWNRIVCVEDVTISNNATITFVAKTEVLINGPFETGSNVVFEIVMNCPD